MLKTAEKKIMSTALAIVLSILWIGSSIFVFYYSKQDLGCINSYTDMGVYEFYPSEVVKTRKRRSRSSSGITRYYVQYVSLNGEYTWSKKVASKSKGETILQMGNPISRRVIEFSDDFITVSEQKSTLEYIRERKTRDMIGLYGSAITGVGMTAFLLVVCRRFAKQILQAKKQDET